MEKEIVKENVVKEKVVNEKVNESEFKIRKDLNEIVKKIKLLPIKTNFGTRNVCNVVLFNDVTVEFKDTDNLVQLFQSYVDKGETDFIKSKELVDEYKKDEEGVIVGTYICVRYTLNDGAVYRLFARHFSSNKLIDNYYDLYKKSKNSNKK